MFLINQLTHIYINGIFNRHIIYLNLLVLTNSMDSIFCLFVIIGCTMELDTVLDFSDAMIFAMALANVLGLYLLVPVVKRDLDVYWARKRSNP